MFNRRRSVLVGLKMGTRLGWGLLLVDSVTLDSRLVFLTSGFLWLVTRCWSVREL
jgi:hypothetical protein